MALSEARKKWVEDQVAAAVTRSEQQFKSLALETAARRRKQVIDVPADQGSEAGTDNQSLSSEQATCVCSLESLSRVDLGSNRPLLTPLRSASVFFAFVD